MAIDTDRLVTIANELKTLEQRREGLLAELQRIAQGISGAVSVAPRRGRPPLSWHPTKVVTSPKVVPTVARGRKRRMGLTTDIVEFLKSSGGAHTAGEIVAGLKLPKTKSGVSTVSTTLVRLAKEGRAKKDAQRGYRAA
jgi:hypothetical protein